MTSVVRLRAFANSASVPLLTLVDMQQESLAEPRLLALSGAGAALANCRKVFDHAQWIMPAGGLHAHGRGIRLLQSRPRRLSAGSTV